MKIKKINKEISLYNIYCRIFMIVGVLCTLMGVLKFFQGNTLIDAVSLIMGIIAVVIVILPWLFIREKPDEMFYENFQKAGLWAFLVLLVGINVVVAIVTVFKIELGVEKCCTVLLGISILFLGYKFGKLERGDA